MEQQVNAIVNTIKNPLLDADLRNNFHEPINKHIQLQQGLFDQSHFIAFNLDYFYQLLLGVLTSIQSSPKDGRLVGIYIRRNTINTAAEDFRIFAVFKDSLVLHDFRDKSVNLEGKMMTKEEYLSIKDMIKDRHDLIISKLDIEYKVYDVNHQFQISITDEQNVQIRNKGLTRMLLNDKVFEHDVKFTHIDGHKRSYKMFRSLENGKQRLNTFRECMIDANYIFQSLNKGNLLFFESEARAFFMHGLFYSAMSDNYYHEVLQFISKHKRFLPIVAWSRIPIPPINTAYPEHIILDFGSSKELYYPLVAKVRTDAEFHILQPSTDWDTRPTLDDEIIRWDSANLINNFVNEIKSFWWHGDLRKLEAMRDTYMNLLIIRKFEHDKYGRMATPDLYKYFLLGELRTSMEEKFYINAQNGLEAILMNHGKTKVLLTFDAEQRVDIDLENIMSRIHLNVIAINFGPDGPAIYTMTLNDAIQKYGGFQAIWARKLNRVFTKISFEDDLKIGQLNGFEFRTCMDDLLRETRNFITDIPAMNAYFSGLFSKSAIQEWSYEQHNGGFLSRIAIKTIKNLPFNFHFLLFNDPNKQTFTEAHKLIIHKPNSLDTFYVVYNFAVRINRMAVAATTKKKNKVMLNQAYSTLNVVNHCLGQPKRRKRVSATAIICPVRKRQGDRRVTFEELEQRFAKKHPKLHYGINKIYKTATQVQIAIIGRTMLTHLFRGDFAAFGVDVAIFGLAVTSPYAAEKIGKWGEKKAAEIVARASKSKGLFQSVIKKIGWKIATVGRCLPTLGFTAFSAYQLHHEIKNNDTTSAILTGTSLAIDIVSCGFEAAAAVGLLAISPIIVKVGAIISTALAVVQNVYSGFREVEKISEVVPLSLGERYYSFKRSLIPWLNADPTLESIAEQVIANEQAITVAFNMFPYAKRFLISAALKIDAETGELSYVDDNTIHMRRKRKIQVSRAMPRKDHIGDQYEMFCSMNEKDISGKKDLESKMDWSRIATFGLPEMMIAVINHVTRKEQPELFDYHCINAFGVKAVSSSVSDTTIFLLHNGTDSVSGFSDSPNVMILGNGKKSISAGRKDDRFVMIGRYTYGYLDGGPRDDVIDFSDYAKDIATVMNFENLRVSFSTLHHQPLIVRNIENFIGRKNLPDHINVCNHKSIDLGGANSKLNADIVKISRSKKCQPISNLTIYLKNNTDVFCDDENAKVTYSVTSEATGFLNLPVGSHNFIFNLLSLNEICVKMRNNFLTLSIGSTGQLTLNTSDAAEVRFSFNAENIVVFLNRGKLTAYVTKIISIYEVVENYALYLKKNPLIVLIAETSHGRIKLSHNDSTYENRGLNIIFSNGEAHSQELISHPDKVNYFLIHNENLVDVPDIPMYITIIASSAQSFPNYIDLKYFCTAKESNFDIRILAVTDHGDIVIKILSVPMSAEDSVDDAAIGKVKIIDGISYINQIRIYLWGENVLLAHDNSTLVIQPVSINVSKHEYTIHPDQFEFNTIINFNFIINNLEAYSVNGTLILTDVAMLNNNKNNCTILTFIDYHLYRLKYETLILEFKNKTIRLDQMEQAMVDVSYLWRRMDERLSNSEEEEQEEQDFEVYRRLMEVFADDLSLHSDYDRQHLAK